MQYTIIQYIRMTTAETYYHQGQTLFAAGKLPQARNACQKALDADGQHAAAKQLIDMIDSIMTFGNREMYNV